MTNPITTINRERLVQLADENTICKVSWDERIEISRALLAVMDAKPFGYAHTYDPFAMMASLHKEETRHHSLKLYTTPPAPSATDCEWTFDESQYSWHSACGEDYLFTDGGPVENRVRFCQGCGGKVKIPAAQGGDE